jgi:hypothetical protein
MGMMASLALVSNINSEFFHPILLIVPYAFILVGIAILIIGSIIYLKTKKGIKNREI